MRTPRPTATGALLLGLLLLSAGCTPAGGPGYAEPSYLKASTPQAFAMFGGPLALSADGATLAVGAPSASVGVRNAGAVYVFTRSDGRWTQQALVQASIPATDAAFGSALALSADGMTLTVGSPLDSSCAPGAGAVFVFTRSGNGWSEQAQVLPTRQGAFDAFGGAVALAADGATLAVGARGEDSGATGVDGDPARDDATMAGAAYVFRFDGLRWAQQAYLKASNAAARDGFGSALALASDGAVLAVGAAAQSSGASGVDPVDPIGLHALASGAVYVFAATANGGWAQQAYLKAADARAGDAFGQALALSGAGATLAVGAFAHDGAAPGSGGVYVFARAGSSWRQEAALQAATPQPAGGFGAALALSHDGATLAVGSGGESSDATGEGGDEVGTQARGAGAVFLYARGAAWAQCAYLKASNTGAHDAFGTSVALSADGATVAAGAVGEASASGGDPSDNAAPSAGAAYVYQAW